MTASPSVLSARNAQFLSGLLHFITRDGVPNASKVMNEREKRQIRPDEKLLELPPAQPHDWFGTPDPASLVEIDAKFDVLSMAFASDPSGERAFVSFHGDGPENDYTGSASLARQVAKSDSKESNRVTRLANGLQLGDLLGSHDKSEIFVPHPNWHTTREEWTVWLEDIREFMEQRIRRGCVNTLIAFWEPRAQRNHESGGVQHRRFLNLADGRLSDTMRKSIPFIRKTLTNGTLRETTVVCTCSHGPLTFVLYYGTSGTTVSTEFMKLLFNSFKADGREADKIGVLEPVPVLGDEKQRDETEDAIHWKTAGFGAIHYSGERAPALPPWAVSLPPVTRQDIATKLHIKFRGIQLTTDQFTDWVDYVAQNRLQLRSALSHEELMFVKDAARELFAAIYSDPRALQQVRVFDVNRKLPTLEWICSSSTADGEPQLRYTQLGIPKLEAMTMDYTHARDSKSGDPMNDLKNVMGDAMNRAGPTLIVWPVDWGKRVAELEGETHSALRFPFVERYLIPQLSKAVRRLAERSDSKDQKALNFPVCMIAVPLPPIRRDVQFLSERDEKGLRTETYRNGMLPFSSKLRDIAFELLREHPGPGPGNRRSRLKTMPDNVSVRFLTAFPKSFLFITISNRSLRNLKIPHKLLSLLELPLSARQQQQHAGDEKGKDVRENKNDNTFTDEQYTAHNIASWTGVVVHEAPGQFVRVDIRLPTASRPVTQSEYLSFYDQVAASYQQFALRGGTFADAIAARIHRIQQIAGYLPTV